MKETLKARKEANARQAAGNTSLAEHKDLAGTKEKEERLWPLEEGAAHSGGLLGCWEVMQGEN